MQYTNGAFFYPRLFGRSSRTEVIPKTVGHYAVASSNASKEWQMISVDRLRDYLRQSAKKQYELVSLSPFSIFFHRTDPLCYFNYAIPDKPVSGDIHNTITKLREEFNRRARLPRFEFIQECFPKLPEILRAEHFEEEASQRGMICTPGNCHHPPPTHGIKMTDIIC